MTDPDEWRSALAAGRLQAVLDTASPPEVFTFIRAVSDTLHDLRFREATSLRVRRILRELLDNVAAHVAQDPQALVTLAVTQRYLRKVSVDVADRGPGVAASVLPDYVQRLGETGQEHGLVLATRLATSIRPRPATTESFPSGTGFEVMEFERPPPPSTRDGVGWLCLDYSSPDVFWIGRDTTQVDFGGRGPTTPWSAFRTILEEAVARQWLPVLAAYFEDVAGADHLVVEVTGYDEASSVARSSTFQDAIRAAIELQFAPLVASRRVVFYFHATLPGIREKVERWAADWGCRVVSSAAEVRAAIGDR